MRENDKYVSAICGQWMDVAVARNVVTINFLAGPQPQPAATRRASASSLTPHSEELWLHCRGLGGSEEEAISGHCNCHK